MLTRPGALAGASPRKTRSASAPDTSLTTKRALRAAVASAPGRTTAVSVGPPPVRPSQPGVVVPSQASVETPVEAKPGTGEALGSVTVGRSAAAAAAPGAAIAPAARTIAATEASFWN